MKQNQWVGHEEAVELCRNENLDQAVYFLQRDLIFMRDVSIKDSESVVFTKGNQLVKNV